MGQLAIRLHSDYAYSDYNKYIILRDIAQDTISIGKEINLCTSPKWTRVFRYKINSVQFPYQITFALVNGLGGYWWDRLDDRGLSSLMEEIYKNFPASEDHHGLPLSLSTSWKRITSLGTLIYSSSQAKINNKPGKVVSLAYACSRNGFQAAVNLHNSTKGKVLHIFGKIPIPMNFSPPCYSIGKQINNCRNSKDAILMFARNSIKTNHDRSTSQYKTVLLENLTDDNFQDTTVNNMKQLYKDIVGVIPCHTNASAKGSSKDAIYSGLLILHEKAETMFRTATLFTNILQVEVPSIFPIDGDEYDNNDGFTKVQTKPKNANKLQSIHDIFKNLNACLKPDFDGSGKFHMVIFGRGSPHAAGVYKDYDRAHVGAKWFFEGVSGGACRPILNENHAWKYMDHYYPGVDCYKKLMLFCHCIPHTTTNMDPLWPEYGGKIYHKYGWMTCSFWRPGEGRHT